MPEILEKVIENNQKRCFECNGELKSSIIRGNLGTYIQWNCKDCGVTNAIYEVGN